jgi:hypothetical protein
MVTKSHKMRWVSHAARMGRQSIRDLGGNHEGNFVENVVYDRIILKRMLEK